jgi:predicted ATPase
VRYLRQAGTKAVARSANREAVGFFEHALALLEELPQTRETLDESLDTRIALGPALIATNGGASPVVETLYLRAREIVDLLDDRSRRFPVLWGLWFVNYNRGRYPDAHDAGERLLEAARSGEDTGQLLEAHHSLWATLTAMGRAPAAVVHQERGIALYDRERHASQAFLYGGHDPGACCRSQLSVNRWLLGQPDRALSTLQEALRLTEELNHPLTTIITLLSASWLRYLRGEREATAMASERLFALASEYGLATQSAAAAVLLPASRGAHLDSPALADLHRGLVAARGASWRRVFCLCVLAELYAEAGQAGEGLTVLASISEEDRAAFYAPEIQRIEGELLLRQPMQATNEAEQRFRRALELARERAEKSLELRAATSLARLLAARGRRDDARNILAPTYGWFTEGFDTADLRAAKALLAEIG